MAVGGTGVGSSALQPIANITATTSPAIINLRTYLIALCTFFTSDLQTPNLDTRYQTAIQKWEILIDFTIG